MANVRLPYPHPGQIAVRQQARRFNWLSAGRRWRKTTLVMAIAVENALQGKRILWGSPVFDQARVGWDETRRAVGDIADFNIARMIAAFPGGGQIVYRSLDNPDHVRGHTADGVVIDECSDVAPSAWYEALRPMLIDTDGWVWGIGTPKGYNWFWKEHQHAADHEDTAAWQAPTLGVRITDRGLVRDPHPLENPHIPFEEMVHLHESMPERIFEQEILAQFIDLSGGVFRNVREAATAERQAEPVAAHAYVIGCDWGKSNDYTCFAVLDATDKRMVALDRSNKVDYVVQRGRLVALCEKWKPGVVIAEANSMGTPIIEALSRDRVPVRPFTTTNATKSVIIDALSLAFERRDITILNDPILIAELQAYESERLPSGLTRYSAPESMHDDTVMALALAWSALGKTNSLIGAFTL